MSAVVEAETTNTKVVMGNVNVVAAAIQSLITDDTATIVTVTHVKAAVWLIVFTV